MLQSVNVRYLNDKWFLMHYRGTDPGGYGSGRFAVGSGGVGFGGVVLEFYLKCITCILQSL